ncbi:MAG TPA: hypothetical protein VNR87_13825 [Flavisolibacter sp.]|nr:hypothetical protein [Flavisolibacter sp.]
MSLAGRLLYRIYYKPRGKKEMIRRYGGRESFDDMLKAEQEMRQFAFQQLEFPEADPSATPAHYLSFLTGEKFMHQTLFCIYSFLKQLSPSERKIFGFRCYDDGSTTASTKELLRKKFPAIQFIPQEESMEKMRSLLPEKQFPVVYEKLRVYPIIKKILFAHLGREGVHPILDSDMLFFQRPALFIDWIRNYTQDKDEVFFIQDCERNYGYSDALLEKLAQGPLPQRINGGWTAFDSSRINFSQIEFLITELEAAEGTNYFLEQALISLLASAYSGPVAAPAADYIVFPKAGQISNAEGVLQHYVDISKEGYFKKAWRAVL